MTAATIDLIPEQHKLQEDLNAPQPRSTPSEILMEGAPAPSYKLRRLAKALVPIMMPASARVIVVGGLEASKRPALWVTVSLAAAMGAVLKQRIHVIVLAPPSTAAEFTDAFAIDNLYGPILERIGDPKDSYAKLATLLEQRLTVLETSGCKLFLHAEEISPWLDFLPYQEGCAGVVVLPRAEQTRKIALQSLRTRLHQLDLPLLGAVLLDRKYPIPECLYRLI